MGHHQRQKPHNQPQEGFPMTLNECFGYLAELAEDAANSASSAESDCYYNTDKDDTEALCDRLDTVQNSAQETLDTATELAELLTMGQHGKLVEAVVLHRAATEHDVLPEYRKESRRALRKLINETLEVADAA
jgi:hypothetical protein